MPWKAPNWRAHRAPSPGHSGVTWICRRAWQGTCPGAATPILFVGIPSTTIGKIMFVLYPLTLINGIESFTYEYRCGCIIAVLYPWYYTTLWIVHCIIQHRLNCEPYLTVITTTPSKVAYVHCTRIRQRQAGVSAITRRPNAFIVAHELGWASTRPRLGPPLCSIRNSSIVKSL